MLVGKDELAAARKAAYAVRWRHLPPPRISGRGCAWNAARPCIRQGVLLITNSDSKPLQRSLLFDIFGNPFRPVAIDPDWLTSTVVALARGIYDDRAFDRLPILADALQDAGCENADVLTHCRGDGPHVRGCWVVDLLLGKT